MIITDRMKKTSILLLIALVVLSACKENTSTTENAQEDQPVEVEESNELVVEFNFKTSKEDDFKIMLNNIDIDDLQKMNISVVETVPPSTNPDKIVANFGERMSNNLLINLGNADTKSVEISAINVRYGKVYITAQTGEEIDKYYAFNKFIDWDPETTTVTTKRVEGQLFPVITARRRLINALKN